MRIFTLLLVLVTCFTFAQQSERLQRKEQLMDDVRSAWLKGQYRAVLSMVKDAASIGAVSEPLAFMDACASARLLTNDAEKKLLGYIDDYGFASGANLARFELGVLFYQQKKYPDAAIIFSEVEFSSLEKNLRHTGLFYWGYSLFSQKKLSEARVQFDQLKLTDGEFAPAASYYSGFASFTEGNFETALQDFRRIQQQDSYANVVPYLIANCLHRLEKNDELIDYVTTLEKSEEIQYADEIQLLVAEATYSKGQYPRAVEGYTQYFKSRRSADRGVLFRAGAAHFQVSKFNEAAGYFKQIASDKDTTGVYAAYQLGLSYLKTGQKPFALSAFQTCIRSSFASETLLTESKYQEAKLLYDLARPDEAIDRMESFVRLYPSNPYSIELGELLSGAYVNANHYHKAIDHIESLSVRTPATDRAYQKATLFFGFEFYNKNDLEQALEYFKKSMDFPLDESLLFEASVWSGEALAAQAKWEQAYPLYEKVVSATARALPEQVLRARYGLGYARYNAQDYERALINFREFLAKAPKTDSRVSDAQVRLGDCYYVSKSYQLAYDQYRKAADSGRGGADYALMQSGVMLGILHKNLDGIQVLKEMLTRYPQSVYWDEGLFHKAQLEFEESKYQEAAEGYSQLITRKPASRFAPYAYVRRAAAQFNLKEYGKSATDYIKVLQEYPESPAAQDILLPLQEALNLAGRGDEFTGLLAQLKSKNPGAAGLETVEFESARNLYLNQEYARAITTLNSYIQSYPESPKLTEAKFLRAESWYRQKNFSNALSGYYEISSDDKFSNASRVQSRIAELESKGSNWDKAVEAFRNLIRVSVSPKDTYTAWAGLMDGYYLLGNYDSAMLYSDKILSESGSSSLLQHRASLMTGRIYQAQGDFEKAKDGYIMTINEAQDEYGAQAKYHLAEIHFQQKNYKQCYETVLSLNRDYAPHAEWVGRGFLLLAESFVATGEIFQAKATLQSLEKFPLAFIREEAFRRLEKITAEELKVRTEPGDSTDHD